MFKALIAFAVLYVILYAGIEFVRQLTNKEKWSVAKTTIYAATISLVTFVLLTVIVVLF